MKFVFGYWSLVLFCQTTNLQYFSSSRITGSCFRRLRQKEISFTFEAKKSHEQN